MFNKYFVFYIVWFLVVLSLLYGVVVFDYRIMFISSFTIILYLILYILETVKGLKVPFCFKILLYLFLFCSLILGEVFGFYTSTSYWDLFLHFVSGIITFYLGLLVFKRHINFVNKSMIFFCYLFSFCFSIMIGVMWEFVEFGFDKYLGCDMQKDTYLTHFNTVNFDNSNTYHVNNIIKTEIYTKNALIVLDKAYLDVGLSDTMSDLFANICGVFVASVMGSYLLFLKEKRT